MTTTTSPRFHAPVSGQIGEAFAQLGREVLELAKALIQPGKFILEVEQMRAKQLAAQPRKV